MKLLHEEFPKVQSRADLRALVEGFRLDFIGTGRADGELRQVDHYVLSEFGRTAKLDHYWDGEPKPERKSNGHKLTLEIQRDGVADLLHRDCVLFREL